MLESTSRWREGNKVHRERKCLSGDASHREPNRPRRTRAGATISLGSCLAGVFSHVSCGCQLVISFVAAFEYMRARRRQRHPPPLEQEDDGTCVLSSVILPFCSCFDSACVFMGFVFEPRSLWRLHPTRGGGHDSSRLVLVTPRRDVRQETLFVSSHRRMPQSHAVQPKSKTSPDADARTDGGLQATNPTTGPPSDTFFFSP